MPSSNKLTISFDNPSKTYFPGDIISGKVTTNLSEGASTTGLELHLNGAASVSWKETPGAPGTAQLPDKHPFADSETYVNIKSYLFGDGNSLTTFPTGTSFPFSYEISSANIPCSFQGYHGKVEYRFVAILKRPFPHGDIEKEEEITIKSMFDLNIHPEAAKSEEWKLSKSFSCWCLCTKGPLAITARLNRTGFCPGEKAMLEVEVNNKSRRRVLDLSAWVSQDTVFIAGPGIMRPCKKAFNIVRRGKPVKGNDTDYWQTEIEIPDVPPTELGPGCRILKVKYAIVVKAQMLGPAIDPELPCPILIGTVPFQ